MAVIVVAAVAAGLVVISRRPTRTATPPTRARHPVTTTTLPVVPPPSVSTALAPFSLPVPIGQALVLPGTSTQLLVVGGEPVSGPPAKGAFLVGTSGNGLHLAATLAAGVKDASGLVLRGQDMVFGGAGPSPSSAVQTFTAPSSGTAHGRAGTAATTATTATTATATGSMPGPRAGSGAVKVGATAYVVGGYDGAAADARILATNDGSTFRVAGTLPLPVRNAAVAAVGGQIYVFGGEVLVPAAAASSGASKAPGKHTHGSRARPVRGPAKVASRATSTTSTTAAVHPIPGWHPVADIQRFDPASGKAAVVGQLPAAIEGAVAVTLGGHIYVTGGRGPAGTNGQVWGFEQQVGRVVVAGALPTPVAGAGATVMGNTAWLVGGRAADGKLIGSLQTLRARAGAAAATPTSAPSSRTSSS